MDIPLLQWEPLVRAALAEDVGAGDITTTLCVPAGARATATVLAKAPGVIAGLDVCAAAFRLLDPEVKWTAHVTDGFRVMGTPTPAATTGQHGQLGPALGALAQPQTPLATVTGNARALLTAERVALNFLQQLSGVATLTAAYVAAVAHTKARIVDTRKTTPGLRLLEKYAVRVGGGYNHRLGLYDCVLIKDNHILAAGSITKAVQAARANIPHTMKVEVETDTLAQVEEAINAGADIILLDNMSLDALRQAVALVGGRAITEASGGLSLDRVAAVAATGVGILSVGALTHSAPALDISLDFAG